MQHTLGFIGLGVMGLPMATNILKKSGMPLLGSDVVPAALEKFKAVGGTPATNAEIYAKCDVIFLSLPKNELVDSICNEIIDAKKEKAIIVDTSSTAPSIIRKIYAKGKAKNVAVLDSPVSGGNFGAKDGTLVIMCGGDKATYDEVLPYLNYMGKTVTYMGDSGCGDVAKLANNMIVGYNLVGNAEAYAFAVKAGLNPETLFKAIKDGFAQNKVQDVKIPKILKRDFSADARIAVHQKDMKNAKQLADEMHVEVPMADVVIACMQAMQDAGLINEDQCALVKPYEKAMGIEIKK